MTPTPGEKAPEQGPSPPPKEREQRAGRGLFGFLRVLGHEALRNSVAIAALVVGVLSLWLTLTQREQARQSEQLSVSLYAELIDNAQVVLDWTKAGTSPFAPPYLVLPVRLFVMNRTSLPQSIIGIWTSFDDTTPDRRRYVTLETVTETDGAPVRWPKVIAAGQTMGLDLQVSVPIDTASAGLLGGKAMEWHPLGTAGDLYFIVHGHPGSGDDQWKMLQQQVHLDLRLMSPSPGAPAHLTYSVSLP